MKRRWIEDESRPSYYVRDARGQERLVVPVIWLDEQPKRRAQTWADVWHAFYGRQRAPEAGR